MYKTLISYSSVSERSCDSGQKKSPHSFRCHTLSDCKHLPVFAATSLHRDPYITIVSPTQDAVMKNGKVLVSVKMTAPRTIKMSLYKESNSSHTLIKSEKYSSSKSLSYYTRQLTGLTPGVYCINISTLNSAGHAIYASEIYVKVQKQSSSTVTAGIAG